MPTTGLAPLPTVGALSYNGISFNCLHTSSVSMASIPDNAARTVKWVEYTITVDATVTLEGGETLLAHPSIDITMTQLRLALEVYAGTLIYSGKGLGSVAVNVPGGTVQDLNWGPKPKLLDFQPLGGSLAARIRWTVTTCLPALRPQSIGPVVQFNEETAVTYDDEDYSQLSIKGTLEIPLTRPTVTTRTLTKTVDDYRQYFMSRVAKAVDLTRFKVTRREFNVSRDKRTMEWSFAAEELPPMGLPIGATRARGTMSVRNIKPVALFPQAVTLRCTYTIRKDFPRRAAFWAFVSLLRFRMERSAFAEAPPAASQSADDQQAPSVRQEILKNPGDFLPIIGPVKASYRFLFGKDEVITKASLSTQASEGPKALLLDFGFEEGLYEDSRSMTFHASWKLFANIQSVIAASGVWRWDPTGIGGNVWKASMEDVSGWRSWLENGLDATQDAIVDMGGGQS